LDSVGVEDCTADVIEGDDNGALLDDQTEEDVEVTDD